MPKILFVLQSMRAGGSATSLLNLIELMKKDGQDIDLFLIEHDGVFLERAQRIGNLLPEESIISSVVCKKERIKILGGNKFLIRVGYIVLHKIFGTSRALDWVMAYSAKKLSDKYDVVIAYQEGLSTKYVQHITTRKRIAWFHTDYDSFKKNIKMDEIRKIYKHFQDIVCVSQASQKSIEKDVLVPNEHLHLIYNTIPEMVIKKRAGEKAKILFPNRKFTFLSVGRLSKEKKFERIVYVAQALTKKNVDFIWYILGDGEERERLMYLITDAQLENQVVLPGVFENPFPFFKQCSCFVMSSIYEAQPMVLNEALTLGIPVITTDFSSSQEIVKNMENGIIAENSAEGLLKAVTLFINEPCVRNQLKAGAKKFVYDNKRILSQIYELFEINGRN